MKRLSWLLLFWLAVSGTALAEAPRFYPDDPTLVDNDRLDTPARPVPVELSVVYEFLLNEFGHPGSAKWVEAANVNTLDEVPDSTWFTNRHALRRMSIEALRRGPDTCAGPQGRLTIVSCKTRGVTPGFVVDDESGVRYLIKFDWQGAREVGTGAEIIVTKLLYAMGYNVPENYLAVIRPQDLVIGPGAKYKGPYGDQSALTKRKLASILDKVVRMRDGRIRVLASRYIEGGILGPFRYYGTRTDDPNDIFLHENRRELRGLRLIAAWLNHYDSRSENTLDSWVERGGRHFVLHHLIDFGSALGAGFWNMLIPEAGIQYLVDGDSMKKSAATLGIIVPKYRRVKWPYFKKYPEAGRYQAEPFDPMTWVGTYPNPAFLRMTDRDAFWAAKLIMSFTPEELRAIVSTAEYSDPETEAYIFQVLLARQRKCGEVFLNRLNPLDGFRVTPAGLEGENLAEKYGVGPRGAKYDVRWFLYDNSLGERSYLKEPDRYDRPVFPLSAHVVFENPDRLLGAEIRTLHAEHPDWNGTVRVYLRSEGDGLRVVGVERESRELGPVPEP